MMRWLARMTSFEVLPLFFRFFLVLFLGIDHQFNASNISLNACALTFKSFQYIR